MSGEIIIYQEKGQAVEVRLDSRHEEIWLSQGQIAELFDKDSDIIGQHLKNIYETNELSEEATTEESSVVRQEGERQLKRKLKFYNLDAIISVGYRVNSKRAVLFRQWATRILRHHLTTPRHSCGGPQAHETTQCYGANHRPHESRWASGALPVKRHHWRREFCVVVRLRPEFTSHSAVLARFIAPCFRWGDCGFFKVASQQCANVSCASSGLAGLRVNQTRLNSRV